jgi:hypothetical protein
MTEKLTSKDKKIIAGWIVFFALLIGFVLYMVTYHPFLSILLFFR